MSLIATATGAAERLDLPDPITRLGIALMVGRTDRILRQADTAAERAFAAAMSGHPVAAHADAANAQHYELPAAFFRHVLGPRMKYSSCLYENPCDTLAVAEENALRATAEHARLADGQSILELGCGWGALTLWMAERYPAAEITAVSNSASQRDFILAEAMKHGLSNITVLTADVNDFTPPGGYDRIVSVEMFEHMSNWRALLGRLRPALTPQGRLFLHVFSHCSGAYRFDHTDSADWIARHFFTGGIMPSHGLVRQFDDLFTVVQDWRWSGDHYRRTARDWLANFDRAADALGPVLGAVYGEDSRLWRRRWRLFFLATAGLFGHRDGSAWGVSHHLLAPV